MDEEETAMVILQVEGATPARIAALLNSIDDPDVCFNLTLLDPDDAEDTWNALEEPERAVRAKPRYAVK